MEAGDGLCRREAVDVLVHGRSALRRRAARLGRGVRPRRRRARRRWDARRRTACAACCTPATPPAARSAACCGRRASKSPRVRVLDVAMVLCAARRRRRVRGRHVHRSGRRSARRRGRRARSLATGGAGQVFRETTNPAVATRRRHGDGVRGRRARGRPRVRAVPPDGARASPARRGSCCPRRLRGEGGRLLNAAGERFVERYDPAGDLAPRDVVARAIVREQIATGAPVYLSMAHADPDFVRKRFPTIAQACRGVGLDLAIDPIPVSPAAHYVMGGVETDLDGRTSVANLFAAGRGGLHRRARRQPPGQQLAARGAGVRRPRRGGDAGTAPRRPSLAADAHAAARRSPDVRRVVRHRRRGARPDVARRGPAALARRARPGRAPARGVGARRGGRARGPSARSRPAPAGQPRHRRAGSSPSRRCAARRAAAATFERTFPRRDDLHWKRRVSDVRDMNPARAIPVPGSPA